MTLMMAKNHLRVAESITDDDDYIRALIAASVPVAENMTNRSLMLQSWALYLDEFPKNNCPIELPFPPLEVSHGCDLHRLKRASTNAGNNRVSG